MRSTQDLVFISSHLDLVTEAEESQPISIIALGSKLAPSNWLLRHHNFVKVDQGHVDRRDEDIAEE